ncbi:hypothetical protein [Agrobacterium cavarae]
MDERRHLARFYLGAGVSEADVDAIAAATIGLTGAHFTKAGREAKRLARRAKREVCVEDIMALLPAPKRIVTGQRRMVTLQEAGHAVVGVRLGLGELRTVAVSWQAHVSQSLGFAHFEVDEAQLWNRQEYLDQTALLLGGRAAKEAVLGTAFDGAGAAQGSDLHKASDIVTRFELQFGMGQGLAYFKLNTVEDRDRIHQSNPIVASRVERHLFREMERSREIVTQFKVAVEKVAAVLVTKGGIKGDEVRRLIREASR